MRSKTYRHHFSPNLGLTIFSVTVTDESVKIQPNLRDKNSVKQGQKSTSLRYPTEIQKRAESYEFYSVQMLTKHRFVSFHSNISLSHIDDGLTNIL